MTVHPWSSFFNFKAISKLQKVSKVVIKDSIEFLFRLTYLHFPHLFSLYVYLCTHTLNTHWKDWCWSSNTLATWCEQVTCWKRPWCWERLRAGGEGGNRGWDDWMASLIQWSWTWANSRRWWGVGRPGVLPSMGSPRVGQDLVNLNNNMWTYMWIHTYTFLNYYRVGWRHQNPSSLSMPMYIS